VNTYIEIAAGFFAVVFALQGIGRECAPARSSTDSHAARDHREDPAAISM